MQEVAVDLSVEVIPVSHHDEGEVAGELAEAMFAPHPELSNGQVVVASGLRIRCVEVDDAQALGDGLARLGSGLGLIRHWHAVAE